MPRRPPIPRSRRRRLAVLLVLALGLGLRAWHVAVFPAPLATADELSAAWCGLGLLAEGAPTAWSRLAPYGGTPADLGRIGAGTIQGLLRPTPEPLDRFGQPHEFRLVRPALDHPPLFSLLAGAWAGATGARPVAVATDTGQRVRLWQLDARRQRMLPVLLFALGAPLLYGLVARRCGHATALLTLLFYAGASHAVLHGRLAVIDNFTTLLWLAGLAAWDRLRLRRGPPLGNGALVAATTAAALLSKLIAASQAAPLVLLALAHGRRRWALWPAAGVALGGGFFAAYLAWQGAALGAALLGAQAGRFDSFALLQRLVTEPVLIEDPSFNALFFMGWFGLFALAGGSAKRGRDLALAALAYVLAMAYFTAVNQMFGWHWLPLYPLLAFGAAWLWRALARRPDPARLAALLLLVLLPALHFVLKLELLPPGVARGVYLALVAAALLAVAWRGRGAAGAAPWAAQWVPRAALGVVLAQQVWAVWVLSR